MPLLTSSLVVVQYCQSVGSFPSHNEQQADLQLVDTIWMIGVRTISFSHRHSVFYLMNLV